VQFDGDKLAEIAARSRLSRNLKAIGEIASAIAGPFANFSPGRNTALSFSITS
jgi:hypothetical protein